MSFQKVRNYTVNCKFVETLLTKSKERFIIIMIWYTFLAMCLMWYYMWVGVKYDAIVVNGGIYTQ